jgi:hypothetical protein
MTVTIMMTIIIKLIKLRIISTMMSRPLAKRCPKTVKLCKNAFFYSPIIVI